MNVTTHERVESIKLRLALLKSVPNTDEIDVPQLDALIVECHRLPHSAEQQELSDAMIELRHSLVKLHPDKFNKASA